jgi:hypothetical protein
MKGKRKKRKKRKGQFRYFCNLNPIGEVVLPNIFQNSFRSIRKAAPLEEPEPGSFF